MKMSLGAKILIAAVSVLGAATLAVLGAIYIPRMLDNSEVTDTTSPSGATSMATLIQAPPVQDGFAEEHEIVLTVNGEEYTGTYEGEYANGLFSGYGVWIYDRFRYEGYFENGVPNGEGTLYITKDGGSDAGNVKQNIIAGIFVNGSAQGQVTFTNVLIDDYKLVWEFELDMGCPIIDGKVYGQAFAPNGENMGETDITLGQGVRMGCVPPWERSHL